ncbi:AmpD protein [Hydrocarboniphaga daqingensis]|uniref:1,6-anhydro-N-acetylmuramyl-L-alanine amidase AmpD n=1 Tax=Hydrocarboniphaga daqingensis TaxID=490188 RepID=A0A1M5LCZ0_9GAMM|nr:1,6-anhydro-N-acetylmuramyl-L-alanine amidase AmpD [Hydrocarboniphaga daqingensis]SHG62921.1 AmpD protein [Hydrocarboniphaga daqingensis]
MPVFERPWQIDSTHRLTGARWHASPNHDERPDGCTIDLLVIHAISLPPEQFGGPWIDALFTNTLDAGAHPYFAGIATLTVSAHCCIRRDGSVTQYVPFDRRAWHAGASQWRGRNRANDFSVGIELEGSDTQPFEPAQYETLAALTHALWARYPTLAPDAIAGHSEIAPGRKTDPGPHFDWAGYRARL